MRFLLQLGQPWINSTLAVNRLVQVAIVLIFVGLAPRWIPLLPGVRELTDHELITRAARNHPRLATLGE